MNQNFKHSHWIVFAGLIFTLLGSFAALRLVFNFVYYPVYPTYGVMPTVFNYYPTVMQQEADCTSLRYNYGPDGSLVEPTELEKKQQLVDQETCMRSVSETRRAAMVNDIASTLLLLFLGLGVFSARKFLK